MNNVSICGRRVIVNSFAEGTLIHPLQPKARVRDDDAIIAEAICIVHENGEEAAEAFLDRWAQRNSNPSNN